MTAGADSSALSALPYRAGLECRHSKLTRSALTLTSALFHLSSLGYTPPYELQPTRHQIARGKLSCIGTDSVCPEWRPEQFQTSRCHRRRAGHLRRRPDSFHPVATAAAAQP